MGPLPPGQEVEDQAVSDANALCSLPRPPQDTPLPATPITPFPDPLGPPAAHASPSATAAGAASWQRERTSARGSDPMSPNILRGYIT